MDPLRPPYSPVDVDHTAGLAVMFYLKFVLHLHRVGETWMKLEFHGVGPIPYPALWISWVYGNTNLTAAKSIIIRVDELINMSEAEMEERAKFEAHAALEYMRSQHKTRKHPVG